MSQVTRVECDPEYYQAPQPSFQPTDHNQTIDIEPLGQNDDQDRPVQPPFTNMRDFAEPALGDPVAIRVDSALKDNQKAFLGYEIAGDFVQPNRESRLRGVRNVLQNFDGYQETASKTSSELTKDAHKFQVKRRKINGEDQRTIDITQDSHPQVFQLFLELISENDPLAVTLAQVYKADNMSKKDFHNLCLDSFICFQLDRFKPLIDAEVSRQQKIARLVINNIELN